MATNQQPEQSGEQSSNQTPSQQGQQRFHSDDGPNEPEEVVDPHTWRNQDKQGVLDFIERNKRTALTVGAVAAFVLIILGVYASRYIPEIWENIWVRRALSHGIVFGVGAYFAFSHFKEQVLGWSWLVLLYDNDVKRYLGYFHRGDEEGVPYFVPVKGLSLFGSRGDPMKLSDMSDEMARQYAKQERKPNDTAKIRLHRSMMSVRDTQFGTVAAQMTAELKPDEMGRDTDIEATVPEMAPKERMKDMKKEMEKLTSNVAFLRDELSIVEDQKSDYRQRAREKATEIEKRIVRQTSKMVNASQGSIGGMGTTGGAGPPAHDMAEPDTGYNGYEEEVNDELDDI